MQAKTITAIAALLITSAALADIKDEAALKEAHDHITRDLKDPSSAQFRDEKVYWGISKDSGAPYSIVCGEVNAKNSYGAYVGFQPYYFSESKGEMASDKNKMFTTFWTVYCVTIPKKLAEKAAEVTAPTNEPVQ
jgi:hypothetical protein